MPLIIPIEDRNEINNKKIWNLLLVNLFKIKDNLLKNRVPKITKDIGKGILGLSIGFNSYKSFTKINLPSDKSKKIGKEAKAHNNNIKRCDNLKNFFCSSNLFTILKLKVYSQNILKYF